MKEEEHLEIYGGLREDIGRKAYLHGPYAKMLKLRFRVGDLDLPERRKRYTTTAVVERRRTWQQICARVAQH